MADLEVLPPLYPLNIAHNPLLHSLSPTPNPTRVSMETATPTEDIHPHHSIEQLTHLPRRTSTKTVKAEHGEIVIR